VKQREVSLLLARRVAHDWGVNGPQARKCHRWEYAFEEEADDGDWTEVGEFDETAVTAIERMLKAGRPHVWIRAASKEYSAASRLA
jgi:hypothetical protein